MASGDYCVKVIKALPPGSSYATYDVRPGGSTPAESIEVFDFDDTTVEYLDFLCQLIGYGGGGLTIILPWMATSATTGDVKWDVAFRRIQTNSTDVDTSQTYDFNTTTTTTSGTSGATKETSITFTNGADMDSVANLEKFILRVKRDASAAGDTMTGDAELIWPEGKET
jgi:hypothetical protein